MSKSPANPMMDLFNPSQDDWQEQLAVVVSTMQELSSHKDPQAMVRSYRERMRHIIPSERMLSLTRRDVPEPYFLIARDLRREEESDHHNPWEDRHKLPRLKGGILGELMFANEARVIDDVQVDADDPAYEYLRGYRLLVAIPIYDNGEALNMMIQLFSDPGEFDRTRLPQLVWTSNLFGRATHNLVLARELKKAYAAVDQELAAIADMQRSLLPAEVPDIPTLDIATFYSPARHAGGDYYDFFPLPDDKSGVLIADVAGHGTPAAVHMAITHALAHTRPKCSVNPSDLIGYVNHHLASRYTGSSGLFVTAFFGVYDPATRTLNYCGAGHPPPRVKRCADGSLFTLNEGGGLPMGILPDHAYESASVTLSPGDQIVFYTDGITETFNDDHEMFGTERLDKVLQNCMLTAQGLIGNVLSSLEKFAAGREADDDRTLLVARVT